VRLEELNEISNLKADAVACYRPANSQELFSVERIALSQQAIFRGYRLESGLLTVALDHALDPTCHTFRPMSADLIGDGDIEITRAQNRNYAAGEGVRQMSAESDVWALLIRYQVNADRQYRRAIEDYERVKRLRPEMPNQPADSQPKNNDGVASFTELGRSYLEPRPLQSTPPAAPEPAPASVAPAPLSFTQSTASPADLPGAASTRPTASQPYIPQTKPPAFGPQAFFSKSVAAPEIARPFQIFSHVPAAPHKFALRNNTLVPILEPEGSRTRRSLVYSDIRPSEFASARSRARAPRLNNPSVHRRAGVRNSEAASRTSGNTCRKHFSCGCGSSSGSPPPLFHTKPHS